MTQERMNDLYHRGLYSPINYYLGLITLLKAGENLDAIMDGVPQPLLGTILDLAASHTNAEDRATDPRETMITGAMLAWNKSLLPVSKTRMKRLTPGSRIKEGDQAPKRKSAELPAETEDVPPPKRQKKEVRETSSPLRIAAENGRNGGDSRRVVATTKRRDIKIKRAGDDPPPNKPKRKRAKPGDVS